VFHDSPVCRPEKKFLYSENDALNVSSKEERRKKTLKQDFKEIFGTKKPSSSSENSNTRSARSRTRTASTSAGAGELRWGGNTNSWNSSER
jgi:hypothetical protein